MFLSLDVIYVNQYRSGDITININIISFLKPNSFGLNHVNSISTKMSFEAFSQSQTQKDPDRSLNHVFGKIIFY